MLKPEVLMNNPGITRSQFRNQEDKLKRNLRFWKPKKWENDIGKNIGG